MLALSAVAAFVVLGFPADVGAQGGPPTGKATQAPPPPPPPPKVKVGEPMPDFSLNYLEPARDGGRPTVKTAKLSDLKGDVVVLAFFPAAFSPG